MSISSATTAAAKMLAAGKAVNVSPRDANEPVTLIDYDAEAEEKIIAAILYCARASAVGCSCARSPQR